MDVTFENEPEPAAAVSSPVEALSARPLLKRANSGFSGVALDRFKEMVGKPTVRFVSWRDFSNPAYREQKQLQQ